MQSYVLLRKTNNDIGLANNQGQKNIPKGMCVEQDEYLVSWCTAEQTRNTFVK